MQPNKDWDEELKDKIAQAYHGEYDITQSRESAVRRLPHNHAWRKIGPNVVCESCHPQHGQYIGPLKKLEKNKEGELIVTDIVFGDSQ